MITATIQQSAGAQIINHQSQLSSGLANFENGQSQNASHLSQSNQKQHRQTAGLNKESMSQGQDKVFNNMNVKYDSHLIVHSVLKNAGGAMIDQRTNFQMSEMHQYASQRSQQEEQHTTEKQANLYNGRENSVVNNLGTKSTTALNSVGNLLQKDQIMTGPASSQLMILRGSVANGAQVGYPQNQNITSTQNPASNRLGSQGVQQQQQNLSSSSTQGANNQFLKSSKAQMYEKTMAQQKEIKGGAPLTAGAIQANQSTIQAGLLPRISNLRNEVTVLFKNSNGSGNQNQQQLFSSTQQKNQLQGNLIANRQNMKPMSSPRSAITNMNGQQTLFSDQHNHVGGTKFLLDKMISNNGNPVDGQKRFQDNLMSKEEYTKSLIEQNQSELRQQKNRKRIHSNHNQNNQTQYPQNQNLVIGTEDLYENQNNLGESFASDSQQKQYRQFQQQNQHRTKQHIYYSEKPGISQENQLLFDYSAGRQGVIRDDTSVGSIYNKQILTNEEQHQLAMTPQIMSSQSNKRSAQKHQDIFMNQNQIIVQQQKQQQFFAKRTGSNKESAVPFKFQQLPQQLNNPHQQYNTQITDIQTSFDKGQIQSPINQQIQIQIQKNIIMVENGSPTIKKHDLNALDQQNVNIYGGRHHQPFQMQSSHFQKSDENSPERMIPDSENSKSKTQVELAQANGQTGEVQPKIPVICSFHKRVLLLTSQVGLTQSGQVQGAMMQTRRQIRNKNPNCNHNNNFTFYQPSYNNVKYDDSYKKKEEVLRKVFFKECAKEEEKRISSTNGAPVGKPQPNKNAYDPIQHLKVIEDGIAKTLFLEYEASKSQSPLKINPMSQSTLMSELGLDSAIVAHKAFLLALIQSGKIVSENMFKVLHEFKQSSRDFDNECIYCKYSQYALRESSKVTQRQIIDGQDGITYDPTSLTQQQLGDVKIEHLVRMFQNQLFKRSFINTSLMIIQKKMNEKLLAKQKSEALNQKDPKALNEKKKNPQQITSIQNKDGQMVIPKKPQTGQLQNPLVPAQSSLDQIALQMQKLAKNLSNPKDKDKFLELKEKYYKEFLLKINISNNFSLVFPKQSFAPYKFYVGKGNNSILVRNALKSRFWWSAGDFEEWHEYNFLWTQWKSNKILSQIKTNKEMAELQQNQPEGGKNVSDSLMSTQMTVTDRDSNSSAETLLATPTSSASKNNQIKIINVNTNAIEEKDTKPQTSHHLITYGHMENNFHLSNKKAIYYNMKIYYESTGQDWWRILPLTFHIKEGPNDKEFLKFAEVFKGNDNGMYGSLEKMGKTIWIVKPGENTNRGCGIQVCRELQQIREIVSNTHVNGQKRSYIIQKYIEKPLLYKQRKFDIRCYTLLTTVNGNLQGYWYNEGYLRTSSKEFNIKNVTNRLIHLTNDAVQKKSDDYGKFESGNKLSYADFQKYLDSLDIKCNIVKEIVPQLKKIAQDTIKAVSRKLDPHRRHNTFEIFGYDFMIDEDLKPWLIEVNTNPCLELSAPYLARLIPTMIENAMKQVQQFDDVRIAVDPLFPPPPWPNAKKHLIPDCTDNKFEIVFNEMTDAQELKNLPIDDTMNGIIEEEEMEEEGSDGEDEELS